MNKKLVQEYLSYMENVKNKSQNTTKNYKIDLNLLFGFLEDKNIKTVNTVTLQDLHEFIAFCKKRGDAKSTRARRIASIKSFFKYLKMMKIIKSNPAIELETPKQEKRNPKYLTLKESQKLLSVIDGTHKERDYAIITLFLNCGLRLSELVSIDIDKFKGDTLAIVGKGNKERTIYLNEVCISAIDEYLKVRPKIETKALFISERKRRISNRAIQKMIDKYLEKAGFDTSIYSTHKLRHTAATLMYKYGNVDIRALQDILGHESVSTTQIYTHVDDEQLRTAVKANPLNVK